MMPQSDPIVPIPPATTLTYEQSSALMTNLNFKGRVKVSCLTFANYIINEPPTVPGHNTRLRWAQRAYQNPDQVAMEVQPPTVMDAAVQGAGSAITDTALQAAVEITVQEIL